MLKHTSLEYVSDQIRILPAHKRFFIGIDTPNLTRELGSSFDPQLIIDFAAKEGKVISARAFVIPGQRIPVSAYSNAGYEVIYVNKDCDSSICADMTRFLLSDAGDIYILVSGDSDYVPMLKQILEHGKDVVVISPEKCTASIYRDEKIFAYIPYESIVAAQY